MDRREFSLTGEVRGQMRPRATTRGRHAGLYKDEKDREWEGKIRNAYLADWAGLEPMDKGFFISITAILEPPKSVSKKKREEMLENRVCVTRKPDIDNIAKSVLDALNGVAFTDDKNCVGLLVNKMFGETEQLKVTMMEVEYLW